MLLSAINVHATEKSKLVWKRKSIGIAQAFIYLFLNFFELPFLKFYFIFQLSNSLEQKM